MDTIIQGDVMTDFQFKALMTMVKDILDRSADLEEAKKAIAKYTLEMGMGSKKSEADDKK